MKKLITATLMVASIGMFTVFATSCSNKEKNKSTCCKTEQCKKDCIDSGCCKKDTTCDITDHNECKHKCCDITGESCEVKGETSCCEIE